MNRISIGARLAVAFSLVLSILIGVGWSGLNRMARINADLNDINYRRWAKVQLAQQATTYSNLNNRLLQGAILSGRQEEVASLLNQRDLNVQHITDIFQTLSKGIESATERELLQQLDQQRAATADGIARITDLLKAGKFQQARVTMASDVILQIDALHDAWNAFTRFEELQMQQARDQSQANYAKARRLTTWLILFAFLAAAAIGTFVTRTMVREVEQRERTKREARKLSDDLEKKVAERTEELARAIRHLESEATERRRKEEDLRRLAAIVECSEDAIIAADLDGKITDWNAGAEKMFGYSRAEAAGMPVSIIAPAERRREHLDILARIRKGAGIMNQETVRIKQDGKPVHVSLTVSPIRNQAGRLTGSAAIVRDITERIEMEAALRRSETNFRSVIENSPYGALRTLPDGRILLANPAAIRMLGYTFESDVLSLNMATDIYRNHADRARLIEQSRHAEYLKDLEVEWKHRNGSPIMVRFSSHIVKNQSGEIDHFDLMVQDITKQRNLEDQLRQAQKMEAIGRLAGGVAHDFNNLLGVIIGYSELALDQIEPGSAVRGQVEQIRKAGERASALTRQLLAFSRQQVLDTKTLNVNGIISDMAQMLLRLIGEDIELQTKLDSELHAIRGDQGQIEQVILNLAVNARDAMPHGGKLMIETRNVRVEEEEPHRHTPMTPGDYILLTISDTGVGMDAETQAHIFEPFFTTKAQGKGTGLGLATVYGVVKQSGGYIWVYSEPGVGATFKLYLPRVLDESQASRPPDMGNSHQATATVLVVEDEASLRTFTCTLLKNSGYTVLEAGDGDEALTLAGQYKPPIHLLLTDMIMPGMNGPAVAGKLASLHPEAKVLFMSGYTGFVSRGLIDPHAVLVSKPFTREELLRKIEQVLGQRTTAPTNGSTVRV
ncbi:MAG: hybrid sensor histidine kinase/response regulator [Acidobacteria bacterium]|nr:MAG: hybrid sensor histidine kinase/response regulator [Acidobacteriota bacterium]